MKDSRSFVCSDLDGIRNNGGDISFLIEDSTNIILPKHFVDYSIIDPPHTDETQFFELSLFYTSWLRKKLRFSQRIHDTLKRGKYFTTILHEEDQTILEKCVKNNM
jgi:adenine-specific DNA methylase